MTLPWTKFEECERIANGKYDEYIHRKSHELLRRLPKPKPEYEDVFQELVRHTLEAVDLYDTSSPAQFFTFLYQHLHIRCYQWYNWANRVRNHPVDGTIFNLETSERGENSEWVYQPTAVERSPAIAMEVAGLREDLSDESREVFDKLVAGLSWGWMDDILHAFTLKTYRHRVSKITNIPSFQISNFVTELRAKLPKHIDISRFPRMKAEVVE